MSAVQVNFQVGGIKDVQNAFRTVEAAVLRFEGASSKSSSRVARARVTEAEKSAKAEVRAAERAAKDKQRADEKSMRDFARANEKATRERERQYQRGLRNESAMAERHYRDQVKFAEKAAKDEAKAKESALRHVQGVRDRYNAQQQSQEERAARRSANRREQFSRTVGNGAMRNAGGMVRGAIGSASKLLEAGGGFNLADSVNADIKMRGEAAQLVASSDKTNVANQGLTSGGILGSARAVSVEHGMGANEVLEAYGAIKDLSGNLGQAISVMPKLATIANATGTKLSDLAGDFGEITKSNQDMSNEDAMRLLAVQAAQGQKGAIEVKDFAKYGGRIVAAATQHGGDATKNIAEISSSAQLARQYGSAASPAEAAMAALRLDTDMMKNADKIKSVAGVNVKSADGKSLRSQADIIQDIVKGTKGDVFKMTGLGIGDRGGKVLQGAAAIYNQAGGGAKGEENLKKFFDNMTGGLSEKQMRGDETSRLAEADKQIAVTMEKFHAAVSTQLVPEITKLIPSLVKMVPHFTKLTQALASMVELAASNPIAAVIAGLGGSMTKSLLGEIASAGIGKAMNSGITGALGGAGALGVVTVAAAMAAIYIEQQMKENAVEQGKSGLAGMDIDQARRAYQKELELGPMTAERKKAYEEKLGTNEEDIARRNEDLKDPSIVGDLFRALGSDAQKIKDDSATDSIERAKRANEEFALALGKTTEELAALRTKIADPNAPIRNAPNAGLRNEK